MTREFVMTPEFDRQWQKMGMGDDELRALQETLLQNPKAGDVIRGTSGLRKIRVAFAGRGKKEAAEQLMWTLPSMRQCIL
jgi:hypothetical protein